MADVPTRMVLTNTVPGAFGVLVSNVSALEGDDIVGENLRRAGAHPVRHDGDAEPVGGVHRHRRRKPVEAAGDDRPELVGEQIAGSRDDVGVAHDDDDVLQAVGCVREMVDGLAGGGECCFSKLGHRHDHFDFQCSDLAKSFPFSRMTYVTILWIVRIT